MSHRILILGAGQVGAALGQAWAAKGHDVRYGVADPTAARYGSLPREKLQPATERRGADLIVLALPYAAAAPALLALGDLSGAIVIDCTNPLGSGPDGLRLTVGHESSGAEQIAAVIPGVPLFKTLNQTGAENMADADAYRPRAVMFVAGDQTAHKPLVMDLVAELGFEAVDAGPLAAARLLEPLALLWIRLALNLGHDRTFAFSLIRHPPLATLPGQYA